MTVLKYLYWTYIPVKWLLEQKRRAGLDCVLWELIGCLWFAISVMSCE